VKERYIKESTAWVQAVIEGARVEGQRGRLIFLDQEKAYDRVGWGYLMAVLEKLGMEEEMQRRFFGILASMKCSVAVNGWRGEEFWVGRGTPQGDPLSPNLYVLAIEPLVDALRQQLKGVTVGPATWTIGAFVDDIVVGIADSEDCVKLRDIVDNYGAVSDGRMNWHKCETLGIGGWTRDLDGVGEVDHGIVGKYVEEGTEVWYLGIWYSRFGSVLSEEW